MQIVILGGFVIAMTFQGGVPSMAGSVWLTAPAVVVYFLGAAALSRVNTALSLRAIGRDKQRFAAAMRRHGLLVIGTRMWLLAGLAGVLLLGYHHWVMEGLHLEKLPLVRELAILAPFFVGLVVVWILDYPFDRAMRGGFRPPRQDGPDAHGNPQTQAARRTWTLREYLGYNIRHQILFIAVPVGVILLTTGYLPWVVARIVPEGLAEYVLPVLMMLTAGAVFLFAPLLIARIWKTHRLPPGHLRDKLEATCRNLSLTYRDILVWESGGMVTNAGVMGLIGPLRYILLSDALLEGMDRRDVEAIFAHEAGHIIHHHIFYAVLFALGTITVCVSVVEQLSLVLTLPDWSVQPLAMGLLVVVWGGGFGWLSRRFERQSDVVAAWASGPRGDGDSADLITHEGAAVFARALQRVGELNGIPARQRNWRHGSIAQRVGYVLWLGSTSGTRERDDRKMRRIKCALWVLAAVGAALVAVQMWGQFSGH